MPITMLTRAHLQTPTVTQQANPYKSLATNDAAFEALSNKLNQPQNVTPARKHSKAMYALKNANIKLTMFQAVILGTLHTCSFSHALPVA